MSIGKEVGMLNSVMRQVLRLINAGTPQDAVTEVRNSYESIHALLDNGYVSFDKNHFKDTRELDATMTKEGKVLLVAVNEFWRILEVFKLDEKRENEILFLKPNWESILEEFNPNSGSIEGKNLKVKLREKGFNMDSYKQTMNNLARAKLIFFEESAGCYYMSGKGAAALLATKAFKKHIDDSGLFLETQQNLETGEEENEYHNNTTNKERQENWSGTPAE